MFMYVVEQVWKISFYWLRVCSATKQLVKDMGNDAQRCLNKCTCCFVISEKPQCESEEHWTWLGWLHSFRDNYLTWTTFFFPQVSCVVCVLNLTWTWLGWLYSSKDHHLTWTAFFSQVACVVCVLNLNLAWMTSQCQGPSVDMGYLFFHRWHV